MIVVATHFTGVDYLGPLLETIPERFPVVIVDTGSADISYRDRLRSDVKWTQTSNGGYEAGALLHALTVTSSDAYLLLQDSALVKDPDFLDEGFYRARLGKVAPLWCFPPQWSSDVERPWIEGNMKSIEYDAGFMGNMFFISRTNLERMVTEVGIPLPTCKGHSMAMERGWAVACKRLNIEVEPFHTAAEYDHSKVVQDEYPFFRKTYANRK